MDYDGVAEILTANMLEDYASQPGNRGGVLFDSHRLHQFILELNEEDIDLHLHVVGDASTREALDAVAMARSLSGGALDIEVTLSHLETVHPDDVPRFRELDVHANFTPHWFNGWASGTAGAINLGAERASRSQVANEFVLAGANVSLSSDVAGGEEADRANPFIGLEMSITRKEFGSDESIAGLPPTGASLDLENAIQGYTLAGARQLGLEEGLGSLEVGKLPDLVILDRNPFDMETRKLHTLEPSAVIVGGVLQSTNAQRAHPD